MGLVKQSRTTTSRSYHNFTGTRSIRSVLTHGKLPHRGTYAEKTTGRPPRVATTSTAFEHFDRYQPKQEVLPPTNTDKSVSQRGENDARVRTISLLESVKASIYAAAPGQVHLSFPNSTL